MEADEISFRPYSVNDINCIRSNWANSYYKGNAQHQKVPPQEFHSSHRQIIDRFFMRPNATIIVCCSKADPDLILGWIALELLPTLTVIHYIYVKFSFKKEFNVGKSLMEKVPATKPVVVTHMTEKAIKIMARRHDHFKDWNYIPHLA